MIADNIQYGQMYVIATSCPGGMTCIRSKVTSMRARSTRGRVTVNQIRPPFVDMVIAS